MTGAMMQHVLSLTRRCIQDYDMIQPGDGVAVGLSGGKDSLLLTLALTRLRAFYPVPFSLRAIAVDLGFPNTDFSGPARFCREIDLPFSVVKTNIAQIVFDIRKESNPCALCAKMRRGVLHRAAAESDCRTVALGHHYDDAVETALINLLFEGRFASFQPVSYLDRAGLRLIRPFLYVEEHSIVPQARQLPVVKSPCPVDGHTKRQEVKALLETLSKTYPQIKTRIFNALRKLPDWKMPESTG